MNTQRSQFAQGWVRHRRQAPAHGFRYALAGPLWDLAEMPEILERSHGCGWRKPALIRVSLQDQRSLAGVHALLAQRGLHHCRGRVQAFALPRVLGQVFNPVCFYFCYQADDRLGAIVAEITNTPWLERQAYVLCPRRSGNSHCFVFPKGFHVSPFQPLEQTCVWAFRLEAKALVVHMQQVQDGAAVFDATLALHLRPMRARRLRQLLWRWPLPGLMALARIYLHAALLWRRGARFFSHPKYAHPHYPERLQAAQLPIQGVPA